MDKTKELQEQLKRKEQECEELKEENYQLQKDCQICEFFTNGIPCKPLRDMDYDLQSVINQRDKYKRAIDMIKEYCKLYNSKLDITVPIILNILNKTLDK